MADDTPEADDVRVKSDPRVKGTGSADATDVLVDDARGPSTTAAASGHAAPTNDGSDGDHPTRKRSAKPRRRWPWIVVIVLLLGLLATSIVMTYEMSERTAEWSEQVDDITSTNYELGAEVADVTAETVRQGDEIDLLEEQLANSKDTVLQLSDEKAQWRDDTEFAQQRTEATRDLLVTAGEVANGLQRCADGQLELMETIANADDFDPDELLAYQDSVTELCDNAEQANAELQEALTE